MQAPVTQSPIAIIGGGIMGCATAYYLGQRGVKALVLEKSTVASAGSGRSAGGVRAQCRDTRERTLAIASIDLWQTLAADLDAEIEYEQSGNIRLAANEARLAQLVAEGEAELHIPPPRHKRVFRVALVSKLNEGMQGKLTLISVPAGFGKTTLLSEWVASCGRAVAWLSLDREDNGWLASHSPDQSVSRSTCRPP